MLAPGAPPSEFATWRNIRSYLDLCLACSSSPSICGASAQIAPKPEASVAKMIILIYYLYLSPSKQLAFCINLCVYLSSREKLVHLAQLALGSRVRALAGWPARLPAAGRRQCTITAPHCHWLEPPPPAKEPVRALGPTAPALRGLVRAFICTSPLTRPT